MVKVVFVKSQENEADLFTKNLNEELTHKHTSKYMENGTDWLKKEWLVWVFSIGRVLEIDQLMLKLGLNRLQDW